MKNSLKVLLVLFLFFSIKTAAQETIIPEIKYADLEKYIDLAKKNFPRAKIFEAQKVAANTAVPIATVSYLDIFNASYFYRPQDKVVLDPINPFNVNGFQFGVNLNLGTFLQKPFTVKKAKADAKVADLLAQEYNLAIAIEVKKRYYDYIQAISVLKLNTLMAQENKGVAESLRNKFEKSEISLDVYNQSRINQFNSNQGKILSESTFLKAKDSLEEIIGVKLSDVK